MLYLYLSDIQNILQHWIKTARKIHRHVNVILHHGAQVVMTQFIPCTGSSALFLNLIMSHQRWSRFFSIQSHLCHPPPLTSPSMRLLLHSFLLCPPPPLKKVEERRQAKLQKSLLCHFKAVHRTPSERFGITGTVRKRWVLLLEGEGPLTTDHPFLWPQSNPMEPFMLLLSSAKVYHSEGHYLPSLWRKEKKEPFSPSFFE